MSQADFVALLPIVVLAATAVIVMLLIAFVRHHLATAVLAALGLVVALAMLPLAAGVAPRQVTPLLTIDGYALFFMGLTLAATLAVLLLSYGYMQAFTGRREEFYLLLILATLGAAVLVSSSHFASFFLGLEVLTVSLYTLIAYQQGQTSVEAGIKYLLLAAVSSAFLLFGMALVYAQTGTMEFARLAQAVAANLANPFVLGGLAGMIVGIGFKLALVPFHMWTPDVYQGAPAPVTAYVASVSKGGMFALMLRLFAQVNVQSLGSLVVVFSVVAIGSMLLGNLLALLQPNVKRILAYSSISQLGYLLVAFLAVPSNGASAAAFYLAAYFVTILSAFGVMILLSTPGREAEGLEDYRALFWRQPALAAVLAAALLSLAGMPLTIGFVGKFYLLTAGLGSALLVLAIALVVGSAIGLYYYLRIIVVMYAPLDEYRPAPGRALAERIPLAGGVVIGILGLLLVVLGVYPVPLLQIIQTAFAGHL